MVAILPFLSNNRWQFRVSEAPSADTWCKRRRCGLSKVGSTLPIRRTFQTHFGGNDFVGVRIDSEV